MLYRRLALLAFLAVLPAIPALSDTRGDVEAGIVRCRAVVDDRVWLDCVYGAAQPMRAKLGLPPAPQAGMAFTTPTGASPPISVPQKKQTFPTNPFGGSEPARGEQQFGIPTPDPQSASVPRNVTRIQSQMTSYSFDRYGVFTVTLANGQIWRQDSGDTTLARWPKAAPTYVVDITRGALGSYNLNVEHLAGGYKVVRLK